MTPRERLDEVVASVLRPLLVKDGGDIEVVRFEGSVLTLRLSGALIGCPGTPRLKRHVIEPAVKTATGPTVEIVYERLAAF